MKAVQISQEEMEGTRVARFAELGNWTIQDSSTIPLEAQDIWLARRILTVARPRGLQGPFANPAPILDVDDFSLNIAICPPGQGPGLHIHERTVETFTCLKGTFRVYYGGHGQSETILQQYDTISVPPGVMRGFQNVGTDEGHLQVLITGDVSSMNDISMPPSTRDEFARYGDHVVRAIEAAGIRFDAYPE
jgi:mannose-6-phosphate isomerase-like protein (cupin superfamily)